MDSNELNKLIGGFLAVVFVAFSISLVSDAIFAAHAPEKPGYIIEAPEGPVAAGGGAQEEQTPVVELLAAADPAAGEQAFRKCVACHTAEDGGANKVGPNLYDIINRPIASHEGFSYSGAMRDFSEGGSVHWDYEHISQFLRAPRSYISGTAMSFAGIKNPQEEANLIAYLRTLSANPAPLPEPAAAGEEAAPAEGEEAAPAEGEEAVPAEEAPAGEEAAPSGEQQAPAEGQAPATDETPGDQPEAGTDVSPETDAGTPAGEEAPADEEAPAQQQEAPAQQQAPANQ
ncbi:cytochrome c family protein [Aquamicrobium sp. LC103]|uniref:c-type cytochrome n=1 Tax=Aquamicrobium sp. LC103 TaxID=1120658 RepID=UPI00063EC387|nr:cytochrome c family protein [Aquamicrobium sp. LC103]